MNLITFELRAKNGFSKNPIYGFNNRYFAKPTSPSYFSVIFAQLLYYMFFARTGHFWDNWDFVFFRMFWTTCLRRDWSRIIWVIKSNHMSNPRLNPALWHIKIICIRTNNLGRYMENAIGNIERFVKFGDIFFYSRELILSIVHIIPQCHLWLRRNTRLGQLTQFTELNGQWDLWLSGRAFGL